MAKVAIVQFDDRPDAQLWPLDRLMARNALYAQRHGYHYEFTRAPERDVPSYWNKIFLAEKFLGAGFDTVAWLDSDAVIHDLDRPIESLAPGPEGFVFSGDLPIWKTVSPINAGVFFAQGDFGRALLAEWAALYPAELWKKTGGKWNFDAHAWAGPAYEQGRFADLLFPKYSGHPAFRQLSWKVLQSPYPVSEAFSLHFPNNLRLNALVYLRQIEEA